MRIHEILEIENRGRNDISTHPRPQEDCHGNNDPSACLSATPLTIPILAHFPAIFCLVSIRFSLFSFFFPPSHPPARKLKCSIRFLRTLRIGRSLGESACFTDNICKYEVARVSELYSFCLTWNISTFQVLKLIDSYLFHGTLFIVYQYKLFKRLESACHIRQHILKVYTYLRQNFKSNK